MAAGCASPSESERIIAAAAKTQRSDLLKNSLVSFHFRDASFTMKRNGGRFEYTRTFSDSLGNEVFDVVNNDGITRSVAGRPVSLDSTKHRSVYVDVNSVVYFASLPLPLLDPGVRSRYLGESQIDNQMLHKVEVTFTPEDGGLDHDDRFIYWFSKDDHTIRYMSYFFHTDGGGSRFRKAINIRRVNGIQFADYLNYASEPDTVRLSVDRFDHYYESGMVSRVSDVISDNIAVSFAPSDISF
ncbi:MAG: DUF6503 family protein [Rhodothermales bacterium]